MKLKKELGLFDVFSVSTGAMFSSGFFLLPGLASMHTGSSVVLAYLLAGILILPAMFSIAEISTALPRSGGAYFFLDRSLGPMMGTIGGIGTYIALLLKTAFALVGIGAYATIFWAIPIKETAIAFTVVFALLNIMGARKSSGVQRIFVIGMVIILSLFIIEGITHFFLNNQHSTNELSEVFNPLFSDGISGLMFTTGFVFVSYLGLTQITSVAEEIKNPERNIPLGMALSLVVTTLIYVAGVFVMVAVIGPGSLANDLSPAASAASKLFAWLPGKTGLYMVVIAAVFAFASTGNAGMLATSRYPLAMGRDKLFSSKFTAISRFGTPVPAILLTAGMIILFILVLTEEGIVKLASTFQLFIFLGINFSVIVFRNSRISSYDPGYHSPFYPWMQIFGILTSIALIYYMGWGPVLFTMGVVLAAYTWYHFFVRHKVKREGAIFHWFALLGRYQHKELENEFLSILREKGLRQDDPFSQTIVRAKVLFVDDMEFEELLKQLSSDIASDYNTTSHFLKSQFESSQSIDPVFVIPQISILYARIPDCEHPGLYMAISGKGIRKEVIKSDIRSEDNINVFFFMINDEEKPRQQLRMLSGILDIAERKDFVKEIRRQKTRQDVIEFLLHDKIYISFRLKKHTATASFINKKLMEISLPPDVLVILIDRENKAFAPNGKTLLLENDTLTIIGKSESINQLYNRYILIQEN
ncbi:MAG: amino acid permease [Draconibacterium sp.]